MSWFTAELKRITPNISTGISTGLTKGAEFIDYAALTYIFDPLSGYGTDLSVTKFMSETGNIFSSSHGYVDKFRTGLGEELHKMGESFDIGWRMEEGILGLGTPNAFMPSVNGSTTPNLEQFNLGGKDPFTAMFQRNKLGKPGGTTKDFTDWVRTLSQKTGHHLTGSTYPGRGGSSGGGDDSTDEPEETVKGPGTLRGREATLQLNVGAKGLGRKSLKIGTKGMGKSKVGKYRTHLSGRTSRGYG